MKEEWRLMGPSLPPQLTQGASLAQAAAAALDGDGDLEGMRFADGEMDGLSGKTLDVRGCAFERCRFGDNDFKRVSFVDCCASASWIARLTNANGATPGCKTRRSSARAFGAAA